MSNVDSQLKSLGDILKLNDYHGFKYYDCIALFDRAAYQFRFYGDHNNSSTTGKYFTLEVNYCTLVNMKIDEIYTYIENMIKNHPDIRKIVHHQEFYNKFDEILK